MRPWGTNRASRDSRLTDSVVRHASGPPPTLPMIKAPVGNRGKSVGAAGLPGGTVNGAPRPHNGTGRRAVQKLCRHWPTCGRTRRSHRPAPGSGCRKQRYGATSTRRSRSWPPGAPDLHEALVGLGDGDLVIVDGTLISTDRIKADEPYYSQKHKQHGINVQVIAAPDGPRRGSRARHRDELTT